MKRRLIGIAVLTALMLGCMTGCGEEKVTPDNIDDVINSMSDEELESAILDGAEKNESDAADDTTAPSEEAEVIIEPQQEILDAKLSDLKVQLNNDVFQLGGYMTVDELVQQYGDRYDFTYKDGTYEERKDYLLEYVDLKNAYGKLDYTLTMTPKYCNSQQGITVYIANITSPDAKVTLDQGYVMDMESVELKMANYPTPKWASEGIMVGTNLHIEGSQFPCENANYSVSDMEAFLTEHGIPMVEYFEGAVTSAVFEDDSNTYTVHIYGTPNAANKCPIFSYLFRFSRDTDKMESVSYGFIGWAE